MNALRTALFLTASTFLFACGTPDNAGGTGGGSGQTCTTDHQCTNGACTCTSGTKNGSSCCDPASTTCTTAEMCPDFCRTCK